MCHESFYLPLKGEAQTSMTVILKLCWIWQKTPQQSYHSAEYKPDLLDQSNVVFSRHLYWTMMEKIWADESPDERERDLSLSGFSWKARDVN